MDPMLRLLIGLGCILATLFTAYAVLGLIERISRLLA